MMRIESSSSCRPNLASDINDDNNNICTMKRIKKPHSSTYCASLLLLLLLLFIHSTTASWVDPDTPIESRSTEAMTSFDTRKYEVVFSDEFNENGRTFKDGHDPRWNAINKNDYTNAALHFYSHDNAYTSNGMLKIITEQKQNAYKAYNETKHEYYTDTKHVQSAMIQSWNKFCFIGGIIEFSAQLPGEADKGGLWPALWMLGNLARATYVGSSDYIWPYSYNRCDSRNRKSQELSACAKVNHYGLSSFTGRGAPEIDVLEAMQGEAGELPNTIIERPYQSSSLQVAPGVEIDRPILGKKPHKGHWYTNLDYSPYNMSDLNPFFYGVTLVHKQRSLTYQSDAISANYQLTKTHYQKQHKYRVEWEPPATNGTGGYIKWYTDGKFSFGLTGSSLDIMGSEIPSEPMYLLMNTAVSSTWGFPMPCPQGCKCDCYECGNPSCACAQPSGYCDNFPASFEIDYVRVFQAKNESRHFLGCSPEHRPTEQFIAGHASRYSAVGQRHPLLDVVSGGGLCTKDNQCGSQKHMGSCDTKQGECICNANFTGPHCRSHAPFYDFDSRAPIAPFYLSLMMIPKSMFVIVGILFAGFLFSMVRSIRSKSVHPQYRKVGDGATTMNGASRGGIPTITSYQDSAAVHNATNRPKQYQNDTTYCVVDSNIAQQQHQ